MFYRQEGKSDLAVVSYYRKNDLQSVPCGSLSRGVAVLAADYLFGVVEHHAELIFSGGGSQ